MHAYVRRFHMIMGICQQRRPSTRDCIKLLIRNTQPPELSNHLLQLSVAHRRRNCPYRECQGWCAKGGPSDPIRLPTVAMLTDEDDNVCIVHGQVSVANNPNSIAADIGLDSMSAISIISPSMFQRLMDTCQALLSPQSDVHTTVSPSMVVRTLVLRPTDPDSRPSALRSADLEPQSDDDHPFYKSR
jgi:hypothetical protein